MSEPHQVGEPSTEEEVLTSENRAVREAYKASRVNDCGHQCYIVGGPFIAEDPECPVHRSGR